MALFFGKSHGAGRRCLPTAPDSPTRNVGCSFISSALLEQPNQGLLERKSKLLQRLDLKRTNRQLPPKPRRQRSRLNQSPLRNATHLKAASSFRAKNTTA